MKAYKKWAIKHPERKRQSAREYTQRKRHKVLDILGGKCVRCGFSDYRALQVDHIKGGGKKELSKINGAGYHNIVIKSVLDKNKKYQLLCANCNWIKRSESRESTGRPIKSQIIR